MRVAVTDFTFRFERPVSLIFSIYFFQHSPTEFANLLILPPMLCVGQIMQIQKSPSRALKL